MGPNLAHSVRRRLSAFGALLPSLPICSRTGGGTSLCGSCSPQCGRRTFRSAAAVAKPLPLGLGDEQRLTQVLLNLVGNAIKFTDTGEVRVTAKSVNGHFAVSVTDTGPGIPEEHQSRIFDQFHQIDSSNTKAKGGTGLGLAIAKQIVEMHGGRIWVESTMGKGSTFQMELPARAEFRKMAP
jgi:signal transduction histidine kinase